MLRAFTNSRGHKLSSMLRTLRVRSKGKKITQPATGHTTRSVLLGCTRVLHLALILLYLRGYDWVGATWEGRTVLTCQEIMLGQTHPILPESAWWSINAASHPGSVVVVALAHFAMGSPRAGSALRFAALSIIPAISRCRAQEPAECIVEVRPTSRFPRKDGPRWVFCCKKTANLEDLLEEI